MIFIITVISFLLVFGILLAVTYLKWDTLKIWSIVPLVAMTTVFAFVTPVIACFGIGKFIFFAGILDAIVLGVPYLRYGGYCPRKIIFFRSNMASMALGSLCLFLSVILS